MFLCLLLGVIPDLVIVALELVLLEFLQKHILFYRSKLLKNWMLLDLEKAYQEKSQLVWNQYNFQFKTSAVLQLKIRFNSIFKTDSILWVYLVTVLN